MSAYTDAVLAEMVPGKPVMFYRMGEASGTVYANTGVNSADSVLNLTKIGSPSMGTPSIVPGDPSSLSVTNTNEAQVAERAHNALIDVPNAPGTGLTILVWVRPDRLESGSNQVILSKGANYQLILVGTSIRSDIQGQSVPGLVTGNDLVTPGYPMFIAVVYNFATLTWKIYLNGVERANKVPTGSTNPNWSLTNKLEVGGFSTFGTTGFYGALQHIVVGYDSYLTAAQIRTIYEVGAASQAEQAGIAANVFPWSRQIMASNTARKRLRITNQSDATVFLSLGSAAQVDGGIALRPGDAWETPKERTGVYTGAVTAITRPLSGAKVVAIYQEVA